MAKQIKAKTRLTERKKTDAPAKPLGVVSDEGRKLENFRLYPHDRENIADIVKALQDIAPSSVRVDKTRAVRVALQIAGEMARNGKGERLAKQLQEMW